MLLCFTRNLYSSLLIVSKKISTIRLNNKQLIILFRTPTVYANKDVSNKLKKQGIYFYDGYYSNDNFFGS